MFDVFTSISSCRTRWRQLDSQPMRSILIGTVLVLHVLIYGVCWVLRVCYERDVQGVPQVLTVCIVLCVGGGGSCVGYTFCTMCSVRTPYTVSWCVAYVPLAL